MEERAPASDRAPAVGKWDRLERKEGVGWQEEEFARKPRRFPAGAREQLRGEGRRRRQEARRRRGRPALPGSLRSGAAQPVRVGRAHAAALRGPAHDQRAPRGAGFRGMRPRSLGGRHVWALVGDFHACGLSPGTIKNLMDTTSGGGRVRSARARL